MKIMKDMKSMKDGFFFMVFMSFTFFMSFFCGFRHRPAFSAGLGVFGSRIGRELEERARRRVSRGALYATLDRLEKKGFLSWTTESAGPERGGHPRRLFIVTRAGRAAIRHYGRAVRSLSAGIEDLL